MSSFDTDFAVADELLAEAFGRVVTYSAGTTDLSVTAEIILRDYEAFDTEGVVTTVQSWDFSIAVADLPGVTPRSGHLISATINGAACVFEIAPTGSRPAAEWADPSGTTWLIRTKKIV
jgi:hypothetical protein